MGRVGLQRPSAVFTYLLYLLFSYFSINYLGIPPASGITIASHVV